jgi:hypothetical protein
MQADTPSNMLSVILATAKSVSVKQEEGKRKKMNEMNEI